MALSGSLQSFHAYAQYALLEGMKTSLFKTPTLLGCVAARQTVSGSMGEPGVSAVIGKPMSLAKRKSLGGSTQRHIPFQTGKVGGVKYLTVDGTTSSTGTERQDKKKRTTAISWSFIEAPIAIRNNALRQSGGGYETGAIIEDAVQMAANEINEVVAGDLWHGNPSSHTEDVFDSIVGVEQWIDDDNTIGSIDRSSVTGFDGVRDDTTTVPSLSTIDDDSVDDTAGLATFGSSRDLALTSGNVYKRLKQEALAAGGQLMFGEKPQGQPIGFTGEYINYNNTMLSFDPYAKNSAGTQDSLLITDSSTWCFETHSGDNWRVLPFKNLADDGPPGSDDITVSKIRLGARFYCEQPWKSKFYSDVD